MTNKHSRFLSLTKSYLQLVFVGLLIFNIPAYAYGGYADDAIDLMKNGTEDAIDKLTDDIDISGTLIEEYFDPKESEIDAFKKSVLDWFFIFLDLFVKTEKVAESGTNLASKHEVPSWLLPIVGIIVAGVIIGSLLKRFMWHMIIVVGVTIVIVLALAYWGLIS